MKMNPSAAQHIATLTAWNSREHQVSIRIKSHPFIMARAQTVFEENIELIQKSKALRESLHFNTEKLLDKIALMRMIVKDILNQN